MTDHSAEDGISIDVIVATHPQRDGLFKAVFLSQVSLRKVE